MLFKAEKLESDIAKKKMHAYKVWKDAKKELREHKREMKSAKDEDTAKIWKKDGRYFQFWDRLPDWFSKFQDSKEDPNIVYRELRRILIIDFAEMNHTSVRKLLFRYK